MSQLLRGLLSAVVGIDIEDEINGAWSVAQLSQLIPLSPAPQIPASKASFASLWTIVLDDSEHLLHNHHASVASLRLLFTFAPECRSESLRNSVHLYRNTHIATRQRHDNNRSSTSCASAKYEECDEIRERNCPKAVNF